MRFRITMGDLMDKKKVIIIGASSGIGRGLAQVFSQNGHPVGLCARRVDLLNEVSSQCPGQSWVEYMDVTKPEESVAAFNKLIQQMNRADIVIINSGVGYDHTEIDWKKEKNTIEVNVLGFSAIAYTAMDYFIKQGHGHIVGISSIAALRGSPSSHAYGASKAYMSNYLEGLRFKAIVSKLPIKITDIQPGFVKTDLIKNKPVFWTSSPEKAAEQIYRAIIRQRKHAYITRRWKLIAWLLKIAPDWLVALK